MPPFTLNLPAMYRLRQVFDATALSDIDRTVDETMAASGVHFPPGAEIAITAGSRGIANIVQILRRVVHNVRAAGAIPFVVPAMGSHGGATSEGQRQMLASLGITERALGCDIRSEIEPVELPAEGAPVPVYFDRHAHAAAGTIVVNRVKVHTAFHGRYESGLVKMLAIGLGKHRQALAIHGRGTRGLVEDMPQVAAQILKQAKVCMGIGIVENAYDQTLHVEAFPGHRILDEEPRLLDLARAHQPRLPLDEIDILVVDRMGKNLSGTGMDGNLLGRMGVPDLPDPPSPRIRTVVVRDLTPESHGNALGVGLADITTRRLVEQIDFRPMVENIYTSPYLARGKIPIACATDWECLAFAARSVTGTAEADLKILRIDSTLHVEHLHASRAAVQALRDPTRIRDLAEIPGPYVDADGMLCPLSRNPPPDQGKAWNPKGNP